MGRNASISPTVERKEIAGGIVNAEESKTVTGRKEERAERGGEEEQKM